jgi:hypothetical protein
MFPESAQCPNCASRLELRALFRAVGTDKVGCLKQPAGLICPSCRSKLRVHQPRIILVNAATFLCLGLVIAVIGAMERRAGIGTRGPIGVAQAVLFIVSFEVIRRWYTPRLAKLDVVPADHALFLPLERTGS